MLGVVAGCVKNAAKIHSLDDIVIESRLTLAKREGGFPEHYRTFSRHSPTLIVSIFPVEKNFVFGLSEQETPFVQSVLRASS